MTASLDFLHGVVDGWTKRSQLQRLYVPVEAFKSYLALRSPYRPWSDADANFLSIDDSTRAGARACIIARNSGHHVTFFVNPYNIVTGEPYFFSILDFTLDAAEMRVLSHNGVSFNLDDPIECRRARNLIRTELMVKALPKAVAGARDLASRLRCDLSRLPEFALPPTTSDLRTLSELGVQIECHGWSHLDLSRMTDSDFEKHISKGRAWLYDTLHLTSTLYAAPFGNTDLTAARACLLKGPYFLASQSFPKGRLNATGWNRRDITSELQASAA